MIDNHETFGQVLRALMTEQQVTWRALERLTRMSKSKLHDMCKFGATVRDEDVKILDEVLGSGLTLQVAARRDRQAAAAHVLLGQNRYTDLATALGSERAGQGVTAVDRRQFLKTAGMAAPAAVFLELSRIGLGEALASREDASTAEWEEIVHEHGYAYMTTPPHELLDALLVDVLAIQYAAGGQPEDSSKARDLRRCGALLAALTAMTVANLGQLQHGRRWWRTARDLADRSGDPAAQAWVRGREIVRGMYEQRPIELIVAKAREYDGLLTGAPREAMPEFLGGKAQALALAGRTDEAIALLPEFIDVCEALPERITDQAASCFGWSECRQQFTLSFVYSFSGAWERASAAQDAAVNLYPASYVRGPAQIELQRAVCFARMGDSSGAARHALNQMEQLPPADHIRPIVDLATRVEQSIPAVDAKLPEVSRYRDFLSTTRQIEAART